MNVHLNSFNLKIKMLNIDSTRNHLQYVERMCLHTWNFGKISYDFIVCKSGIENRLDGLFTMLNMDEHIHMWIHAIKLYNTRSHLVADADVLYNHINLICVQYATQSDALSF